MKRRKMIEKLLHLWNHAARHEISIENNVSMIVVMTLKFDAVSNIRSTEMATRIMDSLNCVILGYVNIKDDGKDCCCCCCCSC